LTRVKGTWFLAHYFNVNSSYVGAMGAARLAIAVVPLPVAETAALILT
jgi:hypothetical protein